MQKEIPIFSFKQDQKITKRMSDIQSPIMYKQTGTGTKKLQQGQSENFDQLSFVSSRSQFINESPQKTKVNVPDRLSADPKLFEEIKTYVDIIIDFKLNTIKSAFNTLLEQSLKQQMEQYQSFQLEIMKLLNQKQEITPSQNRFFSFGQGIDKEQKTPTLSKKDSGPDIVQDEESPSAQIKKQDSFKANIQSQVIERTDQFIKNKAKKRIFVREDSPKEDRPSIPQERQSGKIQENPQELDLEDFLENEVEERQYSNPPKPYEFSLQYYGENIQHSQLSRITEQTEQTLRDEVSLRNPSLYQNPQKSSISDSYHSQYSQNKRYSKQSQPFERITNSITTARQRDSNKEITYQISEDGYLVDQYGNYITNENGDTIQLSEEHIQYLQETNILEQI